MKPLPPLIALAALSACSTSETTENAAACLQLDDNDRAALAALDQAYADAWLQEGTAAQSEALLALFADDAVVIPGRGMEPMEGKEALANFWFPEGYPATDVTNFVRETSYVGGTTCLAAVNGRTDFTYSYEGETTHQVGNYMLLLEKGEADGWQIVRMIWNTRDADDEA